MSNNIHDKEFDTSVWGHIYQHEPQEEYSGLYEGDPEWQAEYHDHEESVPWYAYAAIAAFVMLVSIMVSQSWVQNLFQ